MSKRTDDKKRKEDARRLGLPETASWNDINAATHERYERYRQDVVKHYGLPDTATLEEVEAAARERNRQDAAS